MILSYVSRRVRTHWTAIPANSPPYAQDLSFLFCLSVHLLEHSQVPRVWYIQPNWHVETDEQMWYARQKIRDGVRVWNVCHRRHRTALSPFLPGSMLPLVVWSLILVHQALLFQWRIVRFFDLPGTTPRRQLLEKGRDNTTTAARHPYCRTLVIYYIKNSCCMWVRITCFIFQWWFQFPGDSQVPRVRYFQPN